MSTVFELDDKGWQDRVGEARLSTFDANAALDAGATEGIGKGLGEGVMRGGAKTADFLATVGKLFKPPSATDEEEAESERIGAIADDIQSDLRTSAADFWTPSSQEVGVIGRTLGGFGEIVLPLAATAGNPGLLIGSTGIAGGKQLVDEGVDSTTAAVGGTTEALATAVGFKMPFLGKSLATKIASGAGGNVLVGAGAAELQRELLAGRGYEELAQNYDPLDVEARTIDLLTGVAFGGIDFLGSRMSPSDRAAIAAANNAKHFQADIAPGIPSNFAASAAHQRAAEVATEQMERGDPVNVPEDVTQAAFNARPNRPAAPVPDELVTFDAERAADSVKSEAAAEGDGYDVAEGVLTDEQLAQFQGLRSDVQADQNAGGTVDGTPAPEGVGDAGGSGTRTGEPLQVFRGSDRPLAPEHFQDEALGHASGHPSSELGVFFTNDRADAARYGPHVDVAHLDIRNPKVFAIEDFPDFNTLEEATAFRKQLQAAGHDGVVIDISHLGGPTQYIAFDHAQVKPASAAKPKAAEKPRRVAAPLEEKPAQTPVVGADKAEAEDPALSAAREHLATADVALPTGEIDADGNLVMRSAREILAEADAEVADAEVRGQGIAAAVSCFLTRGA